MLSPNDTSYGTNGSVMRASRAASRRELLKNKRVRNTDILPDSLEEEGRDRTGRLTSSSHLREENLRLRRELETLQEQLEAYQSNMDVLDGEIETIHKAHQQDIEQYQQHLRDMMEERNQMQEARQELERRYQDLYRSFQDAVEEEANKMVKEAAQTLILSPEHAPALLNDVVQTLEAQVRQTEDQRTAELLTVMRQVQYKAEQLEREAAREHNELAAERESLRSMRVSFAEQAKQRYDAELAGLKARWSAGLTFVSLTLFALMAVLEMLFYSITRSLAVAVFVPLGICLVLSYAFAQLYTSGRLKVKIQNPSQKAPAKATKK
jgi:chromosome segregation ATPase